ncbi:DUF6089 family protein [Wenyingzhuangia sp. 2_MG-2023]|uniref:DUF6089 family protein n=1 Tax=Wenyingzhuangia sp. 2_MG-2023 TaxID=3062639 RepID=UPI0026E4529D|nr:DUF6089 family protein [Wenyingzhuangia sp. 2_MG-2023]MDO6736432.1 DUF6089 family protein [Wenyingzhuangia sp. 2_MG-2023]MDO6801256.1 DUF6089 family protein [Wenyingzhuangia sp. 1_MG-2023]
MKKIVSILLMISFHTGFSQIYEAGLTLNIPNILGESNELFNISVSPTNVGFIVKKNINPRIAYRAAVNRISSDITTMSEFSLGIDYNFKKYNLLRYRANERSTPYFILEGAALLFNSGAGIKPTIALPVGIGYKTALTKHFVLSLEAKGRIALTDQLDNDASNSSTLDAYYFFGGSLYYTFGWPKSNKARSKF